MCALVQSNRNGKCKWRESGKFLRQHFSLMKNLLNKVPTSWDANWESSKLTGNVDSDLLVGLTRWALICLHCSRPVSCAPLWVFFPSCLRPVVIPHTMDTKRRREAWAHPTHAPHIIASFCAVVSLYIPDTKQVPHAWSCSLQLCLQRKEGSKHYLYMQSVNESVPASVQYIGCS